MNTTVTMEQINKYINLALPELAREVHEDNEYRPALAILVTLCKEFGFTSDARAFATDSVKHACLAAIAKGTFVRKGAV